MKPPMPVDPWLALRRLTPARLGLGRAGDSLPTEAVLQFGLDHARARDAVHTQLDAPRLLGEVQGAGFSALSVHSCARDRAEFLLRPDAGRLLDAGSAALLQGQAAGATRLAVVFADGLSAAAAQEHALPVLLALRQRLSGWQFTPVVVAQQARVALGDAIGVALGAEAVAVFIGERPGLSAHDSLGLYLSYTPRVGMTDAERNCISNVRPRGLPYQQAAERLAMLLGGARRLGQTGIALKETGGAATLGLSP
jgi:ethanolamine ammonia-lyase small subunit